MALRPLFSEEFAFITYRDILFSRFEYFIGKLYGILEYLNHIYLNR